MSKSLEQDDLFIKRSPEEVLKVLMVRQLNRLSPEELLKRLAVEERVKGLSPDEILAALSPEARAALATRLKNDDSSSPSDSQ